MKDTLIYKGYIGSVHYESDDDIFHGKIEGINDLVTFEGNSIKNLKESFHEAVEDYIFLCKEAGKKPLKSYKGNFNVRISLDLHRKAAEKAIIDGISLNNLVKLALEDYLKKIA